MSGLSKVRLLALASCFFSSFSFFFLARFASRSRLPNVSCDRPKSVNFGAKVAVQRRYETPVPRDFVHEGHGVDPDAMASVVNPRTR